MRVWALLVLCCSPAAASVCRGSTFAPGRHNLTLSTADGRNRSFALFVPFWASGSPPWRTFAPSQPRPLVVNWHGCNAHMPLTEYHDYISRLTEAAADRSWFVITPVGSRAPLPDPNQGAHSWGWSAYGIGPGVCSALGVDDFEFYERLVGWAADNLCVDLARLYSTGFSNGGFMSYSLGCRQAPFRYPLAAVASMAGSLSRARLAECGAGPPLPVLSFHSIDDPTVPFNGSLWTAGQLEVNAMWAARAGCAEPAKLVLKTATTTCSRCSGRGAAVELCAVSGLDHCWVGGRSGGFPTCEARPGDVHATERMMNFFSRYALDPQVVEQLRAG